MKTLVVVLALAVAVASGASVTEYQPQRIVGGSVTTIANYPSIIALLFDQRGWSAHTQWCAGTLLTSRAILTAAHCFETNMAVHQPSWWRARAGSTNANSGGTVYAIDRIILHGNYNSFRSMDADVAILRTSTAVTYINNAVAPATIASSTYNTGDNAAVWAAGWGAISAGGPASEQLRHVQVWTVNQAECRRRYGSSSITDGMLCSGWLDVGGRDQCQGDSGGPLYHNSIVVGVCSWGRSCALAFYPGVNARVAAFSTWIQNTANSM